MTRILPLLLYTLFLMSCGINDGLEEKKRPASSAKYDLDKRQITATAMIDYDLTIEEFYFTSLDENLNPVGDTIYGTADSAKGHTYKFPKTNLKSDIALFTVVAKGKSDSASVTFKTISDLGWRDETGVTFLSTILYPRIRELYLKHGYPLETAKYTSLREFEEAMHLHNDIFDFEDFSPLVFLYYSEQAFNYLPILYYPWFIIRGDLPLSAYEELKNRMAENFKDDGTFTDIEALTSIADFASSSKSSSLDNIESMITAYKKEGYWGYLEMNILTKGYCGVATIHYDCILRTIIGDWLYTIPMYLYGLGTCGSENVYEPSVNLNENSTYQGQLFYCDVETIDNCDTTFEWRKATALETKIGLCNGDSAAKMDYAQLDSVKYKCAPDWNWYPTIMYDDFLKLTKASFTDKNIYYVEDKDVFMSTAFSSRRYTYQMIDFASDRCKKTTLRKRYSETDKYW